MCVLFMGSRPTWSEFGETSGKVEKLGFSGGSDFNPGLSTFPRRETMERLPKPWSFGFLIS